MAQGVGNIVAQGTGVIVAQAAANFTAVLVNDAAATTGLAVQGTQLTPQINKVQPFGLQVTGPLAIPRGQPWTLTWTSSGAIPPEIVSRQCSPTTMLLVGTNRYQLNSNMAVSVSNATGMPATAWTFPPNSPGTVYMFNSCDGRRLAPDFPVTIR